MKNLALVMTGMAVVTACSTPRETLPIPDLAMAQASGQDLKTLERGRAVYLSECTRCHEAMMPEDLSADDWHVVLPGMAWNSGIPADEEAVEAYIKSVKER